MERSSRVRARRVLVLWCCVLTGCWHSGTGASNDATWMFEYPLRGAEVMRDAASTARKYPDVKTLVEDKYSDVEERWKSAEPIAGGDAVSPPISKWPTAGRGQYAERRDFTFNLQPRVPPLGGPRNETRENFPIDGSKGGNFCDEGSVDTRCIVHRELLFPVTAAGGNFTLSGHGRTPFARTAFCSCETLGCACSVEMGDFLPEFADLSWSRLSVEVERGGMQMEGDGQALVKSIKVDNSLIQGQCNPPRSCAPGVPSESLTISGPPVCAPVCGEWHTCATSRDVSTLAVDGRFTVTVESGNWAHLGGICGGKVLHVRVRMEGEYTGQGTLEVRGGAGIFCTAPNCTITIQDFRTVSFHPGSRVATDSLVVRVPHVYIGGTIEVNRMRITAGALNISATGALLTGDTRRHSRLDMDIRPGTVPHDAKFLPQGCDANCLPCTCLVVDGRIQFTRIVMTGISLQLGVTGHITADALGHLAAQGPGAGHSSRLGGGGAGFGGWGSSACASGAARPGSSYGLALAPNDVGYCAVGSRQEAIGSGCANIWDQELGSGGGHGQVQGGQGGGAIRIHMDTEAVVLGRVSADGENSACTQVETEGPVLDKDQRPYPGDIRPETPLYDQTSSPYKYLAPKSGGGGGSGGSIWVIAPRIVGQGIISAVGGSANRSCHTVAAVTSGGGGGGGRIALDYSVSSSDLRVVAYGGTSLCTAAGAGTLFDALRKLMLIDNGGMEGVRMAADMAASFGSLRDLPTITAAFTPWTAVQGAEGESLRRRACWWKANDTLPFGCLLDVNASKPRVVVRHGAVAEFPMESVAEMLITGGSALLITNRSRTLDVQGQLVVEHGGVLGCLGCAASFEALNSMPGCSDTCTPWQATSSNASITIKHNSKALGVHVRLQASVGKIVLAEDSAVLASDWHVLSTLDIVTPRADLSLEGQLHFSKVTIDSGADVLIGARAWVGADAMGWFAATGLGPGHMSALGDGLGGGGGGGGGGHGGRGAEGCADFSLGGASYGDVIVPSDYGSGGGAGGGRNLSKALAGGAASGGEGMLAAFNETRGAPLHRVHLTSQVPEGWEVREVERGPSGVRLTEAACLLRGIRTYLLDRAHQPDPDASRPLSAHGSACPAGYRGSSLRNWCCRGGWGAGVGAGVGDSFGSNQSTGGCDCALVTPGLFAGGRGGGVVRIRADGRVKNMGRVSANGESTFCQGDTRTQLQRRQSFALGGAGAGGSLSIEALAIEGNGSFSASGGHVLADCPDTRSGGGGAGGRVALVTTVRNSTRRPVEDRLNVEAIGGESDGCAPAAAGTVWYGWNGTLRVDNERGVKHAHLYSGVMPSAPTPFPATATTASVTGGGGGNGGGWRWESVLDVIVEGGATLMWSTETGAIPAVSVRHLWLRDKSFVSASPTTAPTSIAVISAHSITVSSAAVLGCLPCTRSVDVQNGLPGCGTTLPDTTEGDLPPQHGTVRCPATAITASDYLRVVSGGQVLAVELNVTAGQQLVVDASAKISTSDYLAESTMRGQARLMRIAGLLHASSLILFADTVLVAQTGQVSSEGMGSGGALGPSPGASHYMGGGGGGHGGRGAQGCYMAAAGGDAFVTDDVASPWRFGSGGGHGGGNSKSRGGRGGGRIKIVSGNLTVDGRITADGANTECAGAVRSFYAGNRADKEFVAGAHSGGGGAGGSIWISSGRVFGVGGLLARGGSARGNCHLAWPGGGGGGGRIAVLVTEQEEIDLAAFAGGGASGFSKVQADSSPNAGTKGCAAGGAGTVYVRTSRWRRLIIDNGRANRLSALTPFPTQFPGGGSGVQGASGPQELYDLVSVRRGALMEFPRAVNTSAPDAAMYELGRRAATLVRVGDGAAILAVRGGQVLNATTLQVGNGGLVGAMTCADSCHLQNLVLGCSAGCLAVSLLAHDVRVFSGGRIQGCSVSMSVDRVLEVEEAAALLGVRTVTESILRATVHGNVSIHGLVHFSTIDVNASSSVTVWQSGMVTSSGLGHFGDHGPGAGKSSEMGGGGGGHVGKGSDACTTSVTGAVLGAHGTSYGHWKGDGVDEGWELGSGGGHGRSTWSTRALDLYAHVPAYPKGGYQPCHFDRACTDDDEQVWNAPHTSAHAHDLPHHPVYEVVRMLQGVSPFSPQLLREGRGSALIRSNDSLCWPRGHAVDDWDGQLHHASSSVPPHPLACAPGWVASASMPDFCCQPFHSPSLQVKSLRTPHEALLASWSIDDLVEECDCSPYVTGSNPGGRGGGRIRLSAGAQIVVAGAVNADGEGTRAYGLSGDPGGGGSGGSLALAAPLIKGAGMLSAQGGGSVAGAAGSHAGYSAGGAGGGGRVALRHAMLANSLTVSAAGGRTDCSDARMARHCDTAYKGQCDYKVMDDEFDMFKLANQWWKWDNSPPGICTTQIPADLSAAQRQRLLNSNPKQGHCWDVGLSQLGWLRMYPKHNLSFFLDDSAHRLHIPLPGDVAFDIETRVIVTNNDSACVHGGLYVGGKLKNGMHASVAAGDAKAKHLDEWVLIGILDHGDDARLQWSTRGTPMEEVFGIRDRFHATHMYMRLVRDKNGTVAGYWRQDKLKPWSLLAPPIHWEWDTLQVGLFSAQCTGLYGNATVDFDYFRDNGARNYQRTFGEAAASGIVSEEALPSGGWEGLGGVGGQASRLTGAHLNASSPNYDSAALKSGLKNAVAAAAAGHEVVKVFALEHGMFETGGQAGGLDVGAAQHLILRGTLTNAGLSQAWNNMSSAHYVTSKRYAESFGDPKDGMMWNGTHWVAAAKIFNVTVRPNLEHTKNVFYIDGVQQPSLTLERPSSIRFPNIYIFNLEARSFPVSANNILHGAVNLPAANESLISILATAAEQDAERARQCAGFKEPHAFVITKVDYPGLEMAYTIGTRNNGATSGAVEFRVWPAAPDTLYYESSLCAGMGGMISIQEPLLGHAKLIRSRRLLQAQHEPERGRTVRRGRGHADMEAEKVISPRESFRLRLQAFYSQYNQDKLAHLDDMVEVWGSKEEQLNGMLIAKYGVGIKPEGAEEEEVWAAGEEDLEEFEGKRRAFAAKGSLKVDDGPQGWMGAGAHNPRQQRRPTPNPTTPTTTPTMETTPPPPADNDGAALWHDSSSAPPASTAAHTTPLPSSSAHDFAHQRGGAVTGGESGRVDGGVDAQKEAHVRRKKRTLNGEEQDDAEAEEMRWRERDLAYIQQQREGELRMKHYIGTKGRELDSQHVAHLHAARAPPLPGQAEITALPGGVADAGALKLPLLDPNKMELMDETTIVGPGKVVIDCGGGPFFVGGGSGAQLHVVNLHLDLVACSFAAPSPPSPGTAPEVGGGLGGADVYHRHAITVQRSMVRFIKCNFTGGTGTGVGGGIDVDTSYLDIRQSSFKSIKAPSIVEQEGLGQGVWGGLQEEAGAAVRMGAPRWHLGSGFVSAAQQRSIHRLCPQVYMATTLLEKNVGANGGAIAVARGTFYCQGGAVQVKSHGAAVISHTTFSRNAAKAGGALHMAGGSALLAHSVFDNNAAREQGGVLLFRVPTVSYALAKQVTPNGEEAVFAVVPPATVTLLSCSMRNNMAIGSATEAALGGVIYFDGSGTASIERSHLLGNSVMGPDAEGGCFGIRDSGVLYIRDSLIANSSAAYGAVLRLHSLRKGDVSVLFNNVTMTNNVATQYGGLVSGYSHTHAIVTPFTYAGGRYYYDVDSYFFLSRSLLRFGFNADPYLDPKAANIAPAGTRVTSNNPYEPGWHTLELPEDPHLTDQWPFFATGTRHPGYFDVRTTSGQKAASGGVALLLQDSQPHQFSTPDKQALSGVVAFKDCNLYDNRPVGLSCCYYHADLSAQRCLHDTELL